ncbi:MAG: hypothetical protein R3C99_11085 [Pirellulaceae bacterium]|nr:hypothetical protein [Planctomycetales bacterium]MCA9204373.1 hypothetical protein [Planctomycetales bacterium]MCA9208989.1 hypothetical protein [Planctomycetales bacterium]MCA9223031.1 hypothetical protein [Planctomycetales bacterium]MCA9224287.1 hypothetical protein [Planctomycetales bacterium]
MTAITVQLDEDTIAKLRQLAEVQRRTPEDIVVEAVTHLTGTMRPLGVGMGQYRSGHKDVSQRAREILREDARKGEWQ